MKKILSVLLAFSLVFLALPVIHANAASFNDVTQYEAEISFLRDKGIINGYPDGSFKPNASVTRLHAVMMILNEKGITDFTAPEPKFVDMPPGTYGYKEVAKAVQLGFISGKTKTDGTSFFDPQAMLTRSQLAKILVKAYELPQTSDYLFHDVPKNDLEMTRYVSTLASEGITTGYMDGSFKPYNTVSRQHFAVFMARMLDDKFKIESPEKRVSYAMDPSKIYAYEENGYLTYRELSGNYYNGYPIWSTTYTYVLFDFAFIENSTGLYMYDVDNQSFHHMLKYPIEVGQTWYPNLPYDGSTDIVYTIISVNATVTTPAGTFKNVVAVEDQHGGTEYYAENIGLIKAVYGDEEIGIVENILVRFGY